MIHNKLKQTISASGELWLLQMVSELNTRRCASEDVGTPREWIVRSHICRRGERNIPYKVSMIRNGLKETISAGGELGLLQTYSPLFSSTNGLKQTISTSGEISKFVLITDRILSSRYRKTKVPSRTQFCETIRRYWVCFILIRTYFYC